MRNLLIFKSQGGLMRSCNSYHGFDVMLKPEEHVFWQEAIRAKFTEERKWRRDG